MPTSSKRLIELDFFRGIVLLIIVIDHIGGSILSRFTLHTYAFNDATEVFVFLAGYAAAITYLSLVNRHATQAAAQQRFTRRALEIYRAFLITAGLMLLVSAALRTLGINAPNLAGADLDSLSYAPMQTLADIALFKRQPYLASVLPMYVFFACITPFILPLAQRKPWLLAAISSTLWIFAPYFANGLPTANGVHWNFNPFAWQCLFVFGVLVRCQPVFQRINATRATRLISLVIACAISVLLGYVKLFAALPEVLRPEFKQDLAWLRIANFLAIAWLAAHLVYAGWIGKIAAQLTWVNALGRKGLTCFVVGAVISLVIDSALYSITNNRFNIPLGIIADIIAITMLYVVSKILMSPARAPIFKTG